MKALSPILVSAEPDANLMVVMDVVPQNALTPIELTEAGISMAVMPLLEKAVAEMVVRVDPAANVTVWMSLLSVKALTPIEVTVAGITASPEQPRALVTTFEEIVSEPEVQLPGLMACAGTPDPARSRRTQATEM